MAIGNLRLSGMAVLGRGPSFRRGGGGAQAVAEREQNRLSVSLELGAIPADHWSGRRASARAAPATW